MKSNSTNIVIPKELKKYFEEIEDELLIRALFEMNRYYDKDFKDYYKQYNKTLNSYERKLLRYYYYYGNEDILKTLKLETFPKLKFKVKDVKDIIKKTKKVLEERDTNKIVKSIYKRIEELDKNSKEINKAKQWLKEFSHKNCQYSFIEIKVNQFMYDNTVNIKEKLYELINYAYDNLNNYRYIGIVFERIQDDKKEDITWDIICDTAIYMENFVQFQGEFRPFKKQKKIKELAKFLKENENLKDANYDNYAEQFYNQISTGFTYTDLLTSDDQKYKILIMKKTKLDETPVRCPSCMQYSGKGNSYPYIFLKSWECSNPNCMERSKSGRGKRYDEFGTYRYFKLVEGKKENEIDKNMYLNWRRDIFKSNLDYKKMLFKYYTWDNEKILLINDDYQEKFARRTIEFSNFEDIHTDYNKLDKLPIYSLFKKIAEHIQIKKIKNDKDIDVGINILNGNSTNIIHSITNQIIGGAITSPPYYNAREYSQWQTLIAYLIDMMVNAKAIYEKMDDNASYLYNIGDIVDNDNVYIDSNMSLRRIMLGFYSMFVFKMLGYQITGNLIWDKGEVQSKRNSTINLFSGYVKYVNCYEHIIIFKKQQKGNRFLDNRVVKIKPVFKINNKGENILGHTAPYPEELVALLKDYMVKSKYVVDPYLGSGTTGIWCKLNHLNFIGIEMNKQYYELAKERIEKIQVKEKEEEMKFPINVFPDVERNAFKKYTKKNVTEDYIKENLKLDGWECYSPFTDTGIDIIATKVVTIEGKKERIYRYIQVKTRELVNNKFGYTLKSKDFRTDPRHFFLLYCDSENDVILIGMYDYMKLFYENTEMGISHFANPTFRNGNNKLNSLTKSANETWNWTYRKEGDGNVTIDFSPWVNKNGLEKMNDLRIDKQLVQFSKQISKMKQEMFYKIHKTPGNTELFSILSPEEIESMMDNIRDMNDEEFCQNQKKTKKYFEDNYQELYQSHLRYCIEESEEEDGA